MECTERVSERLRTVPLVTLPGINFWGSASAANDIRGQMMRSTGFLNVNFGKSLLAAVANQKLATLDRKY